MGLKEISYAGDLTFEAQMLVRCAPLSCQDVAAILLYQIGCELKRRFEAALQDKAPIIFDVLLPKAKASI